jgi:peptidyl-prolyl cis-trans isomerase C
MNNNQKSKIKNLCAMLFVCCFGIVGQAFGQAVVAVNGTKIYQKQIDEAVKAEVARGATDNAELRQVVLNDIVFREAVNQDVKKKGLANQPDNEYRIRMAQQTAIVDIWFDQFFKNHPISEADVKAEYEKELARSKEPKNAKQYLVSEIVLSNEADANDTLAKLNSGADFSQVAKEKSIDKQAAQNGGLLGWALPSQFVPAIGDAVMSLGNGKIVSTPIKTDYGWVIVKVNESRPFVVPPYDEVKQNLANMMIQSEKQRAIQGLMSTVKLTKP